MWPSSRCARATDKIRAGKTTKLLRAAEELVAACDEAATLDRWIDQVFGAKTAAEVLA